MSTTSTNLMQRLAERVDQLDVVQVCTRVAWPADCRDRVALVEVFDGEVAGLPARTVSPGSVTSQSSQATRRVRTHFAMAIARAR